MERMRGWRGPLTYIRHLLGTGQILFQIIAMTTPWPKYYCLQSTDEETEALGMFPEAALRFPRALPQLRNGLSDSGFRWPKSGNNPKVH